MPVLGAKGIVVQMRCQVCVMVVLDILTMHHQVRHFIGALCHPDRSACRHQLPEQDRQKNQGAKSAVHG